jgi:hypothetical protein
MPLFYLIFLFILKVIIHDIGIKKLVEDGFLPPGLTIWSFQRGFDSFRFIQLAKAR